MRRELQMTRQVPQRRQRQAESRDVPQHYIISAIDATRFVLWAPFLTDLGLHRSRLDLVVQDARAGHMTQTAPRFFHKSVRLRELGW